MGRGRGAVCSFPRLISCQAEGCAPIVRAFEKGERFAELFPNAKTVASGLRVPVAVGDFMMLDAIRASGGKAVAGQRGEDRRVDAPSEFRRGHQHLPGNGRLLRCAGTHGAAGEVKPDERVVVFNTGAAPKYLEAMPAELPAIDKDRVDWEAIGSV